MFCASSSSKVSSFRKEAFLNETNKSSKFKKKYEIDEEQNDDDTYDFMGWFSKDSDEINTKM